MKLIASMVPNIMKCRLKPPIHLQIYNDFKANSAAGIEYIEMYFESSENESDGSFYLKYEMM